MQHWFHAWNQKQRSHDGEYHDHVMSESYVIREGTSQSVCKFGKFHTFKQDTIQDVLQRRV